MAYIRTRRRVLRNGATHLSWQVCWHDPVERVKKTQYFPVQADAEVFLSEIAAELERQREAGQELLRLRRQIARPKELPVVLARSAQLPDQIVIEEHSRWCEHLGRSVGTIRQRRHHLRKLSHWLGESHNHPRLLTANGDDLRAWQMSLSRNTMNVRSNNVKHVRAFYNWAADAELVHPRIIKHLWIPKVPSRLPRPISADDLANALAGAPARIKPWLLLAAYTGARACEVAPLRADDLDLRSQTPTLVIHHGKGDKQRVVPLSPALVAALLHCALPHRGWLFPAMSRGGSKNLDQHVSAGQVSHLSSQYLHDTGSPSTFHALRHYFGTEVYRSCLDIRLTQELMGHASPLMTAGYTALAPGRAIEVVADISNSLSPIHQGLPAAKLPRKRK